MLIELFSDMKKLYVIHWKTLSEDKLLENTQQIVKSNTQPNLPMSCTILRDRNSIHKTSQELRMLSSVTLNCQVTNIVIDLVSQLSEM